MSETTRKRMGRPPREEGGPGVYHLGLRFNEHRKAQILRAVEEANERARKAGVPTNITASGLVAHWICQRLDEEVGTIYVPHREQPPPPRRRKP